MSTEALIPAAVTDLAGTKVALSDAEERQARERLAIIQPLLDYRTGDPNNSCSFRELSAFIARQHALGARTIRGWVYAYRKQRLFGLVDRARCDKGRSRFFEKYPDAAARVRGTYVGQGRNSVTIAYEALLRDAGELGIPEGELPSYNTVRAFLNSLPEPAKVLAREGRRAYRERMTPYVGRAYNEPPNDIWVSDHMIHDLAAQNTSFFEVPMGAPIRMRFTCILDFRSRYVVGAAWAPEGSSHSIATTLRHAVERFGPAKMLYCDNGKDYLKVAKGAMPGYLRGEIEPADWYEQEIEALVQAGLLRHAEEQGMLARLGMAVQHCIVRHPQSKHVERFFRTVHGRFDVLFPTYLSGSPATRPERAADAMVMHKKLLRIGQQHRSKLPTTDQVIAMALAWIEEYHHRPHSGKGVDGRTPAEVFAEREQRPAPSPADLALMLMERQQRGVRECAVELKNRRYIGIDEAGRARLHEQNDRKVVVAYDPLDLDVVAILSLDGRLITLAKPEKLLPQSSEANDAIAESMAERRRLEKATGETIVAIRETARATGAVTEVERLARKAQVLPMAVGDHLTQRVRRVRPDETAVAPPSAGDIADRLLALEEK